MLVAGVAERPPSEREVAIEIYVVSVLPGACGDTVVVEIGDDPGRRSSGRVGRRRAGLRLRFPPFRCRGCIQRRALGGRRWDRRAQSHGSVGRARSARGLPPIEESAAAGATGRVRAVTGGSVLPLQPARLIITMAAEAVAAIETLRRRLLRMIRRAVRSRVWLSEVSQFFDRGAA